MKVYKCLKLVDQHKMDVLPTEIHLNISQYLLRREQISLGFCGKRLYNEMFRNHCRILTIQLRKWNTVEKMKELTTTIPKMIKDTSQQLIILVPSSHPENPMNHVSMLLLQLLESVKYSIKELKCSIPQIIALIAIKPDIRIQVGFFEKDGATSEQEYAAAFQHMEVMSLEILDGRNFYPDTIPSKVQKLTIFKMFYQQPYSLHSFSVLQSLCLWESDISDVSMFGFIPALTLVYCDKITDISALNNNRKIRIEECEGIRNYTRSFGQSEKIHVRIVTKAYSSSFDFNHWKNVKELIFDCYGRAKQLYIPLTTRTLSVGGDCITNFSYCVGLHHLPLRELQIGFNRRLTSLISLGLERLLVLDLCYLPELSSLHGLGIGKNKKISIRNCPLVQDYSPLRYVHEVEIVTEFEVNLDELDHVHTLTIESTELITDPNKLYEHIYQLDISKVKLLRSLKGLERIPVLSIPQDFLLVIRTFIVEGGKLFHHKLVIQQSRQLKDCRSIYDEYLLSDYQIIKDSKSVLTMLRRQ